MKLQSRNPDSVGTTSFAGTVKALEAETLGELTKGAQPAELVLPV